MHVLIRYNTTNEILTKVVLLDFVVMIGFICYCHLVAFVLDFKLMNLLPRQHY